MRSKELMGAARAGTVLVASALACAAISSGGVTRAAAEGLLSLPAHFSGLLNDYTPASVNGVAIKGGPYEMHGKWALELNEERRTATFAAEMTMQTSEVVNADPTFDPGTLGAHTHHISVTDGVVHDGPTDWMDMCPTFSPAVTGGFAVTGTAYVTGNGGNPPFGNPSPVTICILGGTSTNVAETASVQFSNFTLSFAAGSHASTHFGPQAIHGVVVKCDGTWRHESQECAVTVEE